jgi:hypothetical protein
MNPSDTTPFMGGNTFLNGAIFGLGFGWVAHAWSVVPEWAAVVGLVGLIVLSLLSERA